MWGSQVKALEEIAATGQNVPALNGRPILLPGLEFYLQAYNELLHDRQIGMAAGSIPWSSIVAWAKLHGFDSPDEIDDLINHIRVMERTVREHEEEKDQRKP